MSDIAKLLAAGYCRMVYRVFIATAITNIIAKYYEIIENFQIYDECLKCTSYQECIEYIMNESLLSTTQRNQQKSAFGNVMIPINNIDKEVKIRWTIEFSTLKCQSNPYFIGFTNHTSFIHCGPHRSPPQFNDISAYFGYAFCFYRQIWCQKYFAATGYYDEASRYDQIKSEVEVNDDNDLQTQFDGKIKHELQFGEVVFEVKLNGDWIGIDIKIYKHPNTSMTGHMAYHDCQWSRLYSARNRCNYWFLALSIPIGASGQILSVDIDNDLVFDIRND